MNPSTTEQRVSRSPNGVSAKPIQLALTPDERDSIERIAKQELRSLSATSRLLIHLGLQVYRNQADQKLAG